MLYWLPAVALALAVVYLWGGTPFWLDYQWCHWGWDWVLYAVLVAVPLIVIGILATRQQLSNTPPPPDTPGVASGDRLFGLAGRVDVDRHYRRL